MFKTVFSTLICAALLSAPIFLAAQRSITNNQLSYTENFNSLPSSSGTNNSLQWTNNQTLANWYAARTDYAGFNTFPMRATDGSYGGPHLCSFRKGNSNLQPPVPINSNRALGAIAAASNGSSVHFAWGVRFKNNSGSVLRRLTVTYAMEQWRKSDAGNEQPLRFSYKISSGAITSLTADETGYSKVPFLNAISPVYTAGAGTALDGDADANRVVVTHSFNLTVNNGEEIMLKWFDADDAKVDHGLSIDDLTVQFSTTAGTTDTYTGALPFEHFMKSVILDIPDEDSPIPYVVPSLSQRNSWQTAIGQILQGQYDNAVTSLNSNNLGYRLTQYTAGAKTYYVVSKDGNSGNYWGTYIFSPNAARPCVSFQAPHPIHDAMTGEQATYLFRQLDAHSLMVAGTHRCLSGTVSGCAGTTDACGTDAPYRISDMAHTLESVFQTTTEALANNLASRRFIQMHGFGQTVGDPHFILSNGTRQTPNHDFVAQLGQALQTAGWNFEAPHLNTSYTKLIATTNTQGRFLNNYNQGNICTGTNISTIVTSRFLHIEQFNEMRTDPNNYPVMATALGSNDVCNCNVSASKATPTDRQSIAASKNYMEIRYGTAPVCHLETELPTTQLTIYNLMGQTLSQQTVAVSGYADAPLPMDLMPKGVYLVSALFGEERQTIRLVVP